MSGECEKCNEHILDCQCDEDCTIEEMAEFAVNEIIEAIARSIKEKPR